MNPRVPSGILCIMNGHMEKRRVVIVGGGISGMGLVYLLGKRSDYEVTLIEAGAYLGGHANAKWVDQELIDTGFMVCNERTYPNIMQLFWELEIDLEPTTMAFACDDEQTNFSICYHNIPWRVWYTLRKLPFIVQVMIAQWRIRKDLHAGKIQAEETIESYCMRRKIPQRARDYFIIPVVASVWSQMEEDKALAMPAKQIFNFMDNHRLLQSRQPQWYSIKGSSWSYVEQIQNLRADSVILGAEVERVENKGEHKEISYIVDGEHKTIEADCVVYACHSEDIPRLCADLDAQQQAITEAVAYSQNDTVMHMDPRWMPRNPDEWGAWNFVREASNNRYVCTYWLNRLQHLENTENIFITLNPSDEIDAGKILERMNYAHPIFTTQSSEVMDTLDGVQGKDGYYFAGAWTRHGFHEDGLWSVVKVYEHLTGEIPQGYTTD